MTQTSIRQPGQDATLHPQDFNGLETSVPALRHPYGSSNIQVPNHEDDLTFHDLPPFPDDVPLAPLYRLSLKKLLDHDPAEEDRLWKACCELGFFYLDLRSSGSSSSSSSSSSEPPKRDSFHSHNDEVGIEKDDCEIDGEALLQDVEALFPLGEQIFSLPQTEKQKYDFYAQNSYFGYKGLGAGVIDSKGTRDGNEFYNVSKDDILGLPGTAPLPAPEMLQKAESRAILKSYIIRSHAIVTFLLERLNTKLQLPPHTLPNLHRLRAVSGDQVRWVHSPPGLEEKNLALGQHTDFGSLTVLFNRLGGLQILPPESISPQQEWCYVKPLKHHCVINLGDAMVKFTAGVLRSNLHRVVAPPGQQKGSTRMSLVYFARPEDDVVLRRLEGSEVIDEEARRKGEGERVGEEEEGEKVTAKEWILRRALGRRVGGNYERSAGTEGGRDQM